MTPTTKSLDNPHTHHLQSEQMCDTSNIQQHSDEYDNPLRSLQQIVWKETEGGARLVRSLLAIAEGNANACTPWHQIEAAKLLIKIGGDPNQANGSGSLQANQQTPEPAQPAAREADISTPTPDLSRHSREACPRPRSGSGNPVGQGGGGINTPSPSTGEGRDGGEKSLSSPPSMSIPTQEDKNTYNYTKTDPDPEQDCYYEPLSPEDQALFDYQTLIDSGEYKEGEIEIQPPSEAAHREYAATLKWMRQAATAEGIPLLPNPLSGTLKRPTARSP